jgi:hypothetical protein
VARVNVAELIEKLQTVEDKTQTVYHTDYEYQNVEVTEVEVAASFRAWVGPDDSRRDQFGYAEISSGLVLD